MVHRKVVVDVLERDERRLTMLDNAANPVRGQCLLPRFRAVWLVDNDRFFASPTNTRRQSDTRNTDHQARTWRSGTAGSAISNSSRRESERERGTWREGEKSGESKGRRR